MSKRSNVYCQAILGSWIPFLLLFIGFFSPFWVLDKDVHRGLFYESYPGGSATSKLVVLDQAIFGLLATSLILLLLQTFFCITTVVCYGPDADGDIDNDDKRCVTCSCCGFHTFNCLSIVASILTLAAVCKCVKDFPADSLGAAYFCCVASCSLQFLMYLIAICDGVCKLRHQQFIYHVMLEEIYEDTM